MSSDSWLFKIPNLRSIPVNSIATWIRAFDNFGGKLAGYWWDPSTLIICLLAPNKIYEWARARIRSRDGELQDFKINAQVSWNFIRSFMKLHNKFRTVLFQDRTSKVPDKKKDRDKITHSYQNVPAKILETSGTSFWKYDFNEELSGWKF